MCIEMRATGRVSTAQKAVPENLRAIGYLVVGEHPAIEAIAAICGAGTACCAGRGAYSAR